MKKKSPRGIPDFSRHHPTPEARLAAPGNAAKAAPPPASPRPVVKPQATSQKSGRRGQ
jgi:hypothetical protein